jgi:hypothetical protein
LVTLDGLACARRPLHTPEQGSGMASALGTDRSWSPICKSRLPEKARKWLGKCDQV